MVVLSDFFIDLMRDFDVLFCYGVLVGVKFYLKFFIILKFLSFF